MSAVDHLTTALQEIVRGANLSMPIYGTHPALTAALRLAERALENYSQASNNEAKVEAARKVTAEEWQAAQDEVAKVTKREKVRVESARVLMDEGCFEMHEEDCPEDDTCSCPLMPLVHAVLNDNDNVDIEAAEAAIAAWDDVKDVE